MKKILSLILILFSLMLTSCAVSEAQVSYGYSYYDYERPSLTVVYRNSIPYYYIYDELTCQWSYRLVPRERIPYIRRGYRPLYHNHGYYNHHRQVLPHHSHRNYRITPNRNHGNRPYHSGNQRHSGRR